MLTSRLERASEEAGAGTRITVLPLKSEASGIGHIPDNFLEDQLFDRIGSPVDHQGSMVIDQTPAALLPARGCDEHTLLILMIIW
jgi:hypothetical protein